MPQVKGTNRDTFISTLKIYLQSPGYIIPCPKAPKVQGITTTPSKD